MNTMRIRELFRDSHRLLLAVEHVALHSHKGTMGSHLSALVEPVAVIVCGPEIIYAMDMQARPIAYDQLRQQLPELGSLLAGFLHGQ